MLQKWALLFPFSRKYFSILYPRDKKGWNVRESLMMDGGFENPAINLKKVIFWPDTIISLFQRFNVKKQFDLLSVDTDSYDFFMLEAILEGGFRPRVIIIEININFDLEEAKSIMPKEKNGSWKRWDRTAYHGMSKLACQYLFNRFSYSLVWCNFVNCIGIQDDILGEPVRLPIQAFSDPRHKVTGHRCDKHKRPIAIITSEGKYEGDNDNGMGSPRIR